MGTSIFPGAIFTPCAVVPLSRTRYRGRYVRRSKTAQTLRLPKQLHVPPRPRSTHRRKPLIAARTHFTLGFQHVLPLPQRLALIVGLLTAAQRDLDLGSSVDKVELQGHNGIAFIVHAGVETIDLLPVEE